MSKDDRWRFTPDDVTRELVEYVCEQSGRKRADVLREALQIGIEPIVKEVDRRRRHKRRN